MLEMTTGSTLHDGSADTSVKAPTSISKYNHQKQPSVPRLATFVMITE
jgi:hypothetical protein